MIPSFDQPVVVVLLDEDTDHAMGLVERDDARQPQALRVQRA